MYFMILYWRHCSNVKLVIRKYDFIFYFVKESYGLLTLYAQTPQNDQSHLNNSAVADKLFECI